MYYVLFVFAMLTPVLMAVVGLIWRIHPPKRDGGFLAYRTALSSKTEETWAFAHRHISKLWLRIGLLWLIGGQMVFLCISAFLVDALLKNTFDENGLPIER